MIVYTGNGPLVFAAALIVIVVGLPCALLEKWYGPHPALGALRLMGFLAGLTLAGLWCWIYGRRWNKEATLHTVYGIPFQYFAFVYWGFGLFCAGIVAWKWVTEVVAA